MMKDKTYFIPICAILLLIIGIFALYSATYTSEATVDISHYTFLQLKWIIIGIISAVVAYLINYKRLLEISYLAYVVNIILLAVLLITNNSSGASRWLTIFGVNFQPSEFMKLVIILTLTRYLSSYKYEEKGLKSVAVIFALVFLPLFLIIQQPDLGTALIFIPLLFVTLYVWSGRLKHIVVTLLAGAALSPFLWYFLKDYQKERLLVFLNPNIDPLGAGYTIIQSKIAIGSGGILGKGWLHGSQTQLNFLPEHHTDFIFSSIAEETGLIGALVVIVLYFLIIWEGFNIAQDSSIMEKKLIASGITTLLALHVIINICMTLGLMPVVGLPLPFISYGGSHTVMFLIMVAILLNLKYR